MEKRTKAVLIAAITVFLCSTLFFLKVNAAQALTSAMIDEKELGEHCIQQIIPHVNIENGAETAKNDDKKYTEKEKTADEPADKKTAKSNGDAENPEIVAEGEPLVIIYHTHSSESYMPYSESNYHREEEEGTVRDVGNVMESELKKRGINVVHDKTLHDRPSYNESYTRSLETIQKLSGQYPSAVYIIDLHRDAAAASAKEGKYIEIDGKRVAKFSLVVGKANENYETLSDFVNVIVKRAEEKYTGFGGNIIEKDYKFNQFVTDRAILLEVGNNKNTIEEARLCGKYFADILASVINEEQ